MELARDAGKNIADAVAKMAACGCDLREISARTVSVIQTKTYGQAGLYVCDFDGIKTFVKIAPKMRLPIYNWKDRRGRTNIADTEIRVLRLINERCDEFTPHFAKLYHISECGELTEEEVRKCDRLANGPIPDIDATLGHVCQFREMALSGFWPMKFVVMYSEMAGVSLHDFLRFNLPLNKFMRLACVETIIFQITYTLLVFERKLPGFKHNDLHLNNVMVSATRFVNPFSQHYVRYVVDGADFNVPDFGFDIKIIDFGHAEVASEGIKSEAIVDQLGEVSENPIKGWTHLVPDILMIVLELQAVLAAEDSMASLFANVVGYASYFSYAMNHRILSEKVGIFKETLAPSLVIHRAFSKFKIAVDESLLDAKYTAPQ